MAAQTTFTYTISDGVSQATATVTVNITDVTPIAMAQNDSASVEAGNILIYDVLANDSPPGVVLNAIMTPPTRGVAVIESGKIKYTPNSGATGADSLVYQVRLPENNSTATATLSIEIKPVSAPGVFTWGYAFPRADAVNPGRVFLWSFGQARPTGYGMVGDILVVQGANGPTTSVENGPGFDLVGPIFICGIDYQPIPNRLGSSRTSDPYRGTNNIIQIHFANNAQAHAMWEHETGQFVNWPFIFWCNSRVNFLTNGCHFGDIMRGGLKGAQTIDPVTKASRGPQCALFWNKIFIERGPHYADDEFNAAGAPTGRTNIFHSDGWQQSGTATVGNTIVWRFADVYFNWIMGQACFCANQAEKWGFPRGARQKYKNCAWEHDDPWSDHPDVPMPGTGGAGNLWTSPRMVMNFEGGFGPAPVELSDYGAGKYWAAVFEGQCYIKKKARVCNPDLDNFGRPFRTDSWRYLAPTGSRGGQGMQNPIWDANGNWRFTTAVQPTHNYPAWAGNIRLLDRTQNLPQVVDPAHTGVAHRITSVAQFMTAIGR